MNSIEFRRVSFWKADYSVSIDGLTVGKFYATSLLKNDFVLKIDEETWSVRKKGFWKGFILLEHNGFETELPLNWKFNTSIQVASTQFDLKFEGFFMRNLIWTDRNNIQIMKGERPRYNYVKFEILDGKIKREVTVKLALIGMFINLLKTKAASAAMS